MSRISTREQSCFKLALTVIIILMLTAAQQYNQHFFPQFIFLECLLVIITCLEKAMYYHNVFVKNFVIKPSLKLKKPIKL